MADQRLRFRSFNGGLSDDDTLGPPNSAADMTAIDFRKSPARLTLQRALTTEASGTGFKGPRSYDAVRVSTGDMYFANGAFTYKRTPGSNGAVGTYTEETDSNGRSIPSADLDYRPDLDALFLFGTSTIHEKSPLSNSPTYKIDKYAARLYFKQDVSASKTSYALIDTSIIEYPSASDKSDSDTHRIPFTCLAEPLNRVEFIYVDSSGSPDITCVVHDNANNEICRQTITNSKLPEPGDLIVFDQFAGTTRMTIGADYHLHMLVSAGTVHLSGTSGGGLNLQASCTCFIYANVLVPTPAFIGHATHQFGAKTYFCNEHYIGEWEFLDTSGNTDITTASNGYDPHRVILPANFVSIGMTEYSEYLITACAIRDSIESTSGSTNGNAGTGMLIFWNTTDDTFDFMVPVPQGVPEGVFTYKNRIYFIARGRLYYWAGGTLTSNADIVEVYEFPGVDQPTFSAAGDAPKVDTYLSAARHCMTVHDGLLKVGYPFQTANTNLKIGVYSFGANKAGQPEAVGFDYVTCNGNTTTTFATGTSPDTPATGISLVKSSSGTLLTAWTHGLGTNAGIDRLNDTSLFAASASWRSLWFDNGDPDIEKTPKALKVTFEALQAGCTVTPFVQYDHSGTDITGTSGGSQIKAVAGNVDVILPLDANNGFYQAQAGVTLASANGNDIKVTSITFKFDDNHNNNLATENPRNVV